MNSLNSFLDNPTNQVIFMLLVMWSLIWKGIALWRSSQNGQRNWFIVLLVINTFGILEIIYIFYFSKAKNDQPKNKI
ncbi:MAG: hypothetical protein A3C58_03680 [Candidatus Staskawiczbacteria bacterium RIFCSPHIGHO2_02_FULL_34_10]|uniref:DUF5652 domain-containing protein n=1 Tax=Candidatus Staskawiczbacteria bacterium RIFCSPHIGHO2_02_FULL_34_10 TaxID=1802205 RepID=A0A1G2I000_9BACT|nr:MAG: hypothetical protein A3C58_03680 [Candidatus Staskawiczbacteria bacterium RIFCSPHIGHO2_02_FULL_34_10]